MSIEEFPAGVILARLLVTIDPRDEGDDRMQAAVMFMIITCMQLGAKKEDKDDAIDLISKVLECNWDVAFDTQTLVQETGGTA
jgi:hypothetical protein